MLHSMLLYQSIVQNSYSWNCNNTSKHTLKYPVLTLYPAERGNSPKDLDLNLLFMTELFLIWMCLVRPEGRSVLWGEDCKRKWTWGRVSWALRSVSGAFQDLVICSVWAVAEPAKYKYFLLMHHVDRDFCIARVLSPALSSFLISAL